MTINPEQVINAIIAIANPLIKEKIRRNETVIKLLQQFKLDPEHPPADMRCGGKWNGILRAIARLLLWQNLGRATPTRFYSKFSNPVKI